jgi:hypothetical protein
MNFSGLVSINLYHNIFCKTILFNAGNLWQQFDTTNQGCRNL